MLQAFTQNGHALFLTPARLGDMGEGEHSPGVARAGLEHRARNILRPLKIAALDVLLHGLKLGEERIELFARLDRLEGLAIPSVLEEKPAKLHPAAEIVRRLPQPVFEASDGRAAVSSGDVFIDLPEQGGVGVGFVHIGPLTRNAETFASAFPFHPCPLAYWV
jgi:hypothetical protein